VQHSRPVPAPAPAARPRAARPATTGLSRSWQPFHHGRKSFEFDVLHVGHAQWLGCASLGRLGSCSLGLLTSCTATEAVCMVRATSDASPGTKTTGYPPRRRAMITILSPSKTLDFDTPPQTPEFTEPQFLDDSEELVEILQDYDVEELGKLMDISEKLSTLNVERYQQWETPFTPGNAKQALMAFTGDVYRDFELDAYSDADFHFAQDHVRILSGLYGVLRPLDLMQAYRLEMGTRLENPRGKNLYEFWGTKIAENLNQASDAHAGDVLLNLASNEYFKSIDQGALSARVVDVRFLEQRKGKWKTITFNLKRARGTMTNWLVRNRIDDVARVPEFAEDRYYFSDERSSDDELVFLRHPK
jgi:cytoplasmic iron level regulating protein YaaA (DUF328/UPF0246 family)